MLRRLVLAAFVLMPLSATDAAVLDGVAMPDNRVVNGTRMALNGIGLRTYSLLGIPIYVAGLYLERRSDNSDGILHSSETKLLEIHFVRDVGTQDAQQAWRTGFANNCQPPACHIDPSDIERFVASVPSIHRGDDTRMLFTASGVSVTFNGRSLGDIHDHHFAETLLATFLGPAPPTPALKRALLGGQD